MSKEKKYNYDMIVRDKWNYYGCTSLDDIFERIEGKKKYFEDIQKVLSEFGRVSIEIDVDKDDDVFIRIIGCEKSIPRKILKKYRIFKTDFDPPESPYRQYPFFLD